MPTAQTSWNMLFAHSMKACSIFRSRFAVGPKKKSATRWWSQHEIWRQIYDHWEGLMAFTDKIIAADIAPASAKEVKAALTPTNRVLDRCVIAIREGNV